jgi:hypothetical protein
MRYICFILLVILFIGCGTTEPFYNPEGNGPYIQIEGYYTPSNLRDPAGTVIGTELNSMLMVPTHRFTKYIGAGVTGVKTPSNPLITNTWYIKTGVRIYLGGQ